jgi:hypothetical protein
MLNASVFLASLLSLTSLPLVAQDGTRRIRESVEWLADDARQGRGVGTAGLDSTAHWLARRFAQLGLVQSEGVSQFLQWLTIDASAPAAAHAGLGGVRVANVVGILPGRGTLAGEAVVVGAHYDHLGLGGMGSMDPDSTGVIHNGADDNASGTAALLEIARNLRQRPAVDRRTIILVAFTAEELGLIGSQYYVDHPVLPNAQTVAMVNLDMVGRLRENRLLALGAESAPEWQPLLDSLNRYDLDIRASGDGWGRSDHSSFYGKNIPVIHFFTDTHEEYHRVVDDVPLINAQGIARVAALSADLVWALAVRPTRLTYVSAPPPAPISGGDGASLGTIPDMSSSPGGVRITGVRQGTAAAVAGLQAGDIIVRIGIHAVTDLYAMTAALAAHSPGDVVDVEVLRDNTRRVFTATLGRRGS